MIEMVTTLVVAGILVSLASPKLNGVIAQSRVRALLDQMASDIAYARMLAVREGQPTSVRLSATEYAITVDNPAKADTVKRVRIGDDYGKATRLSGATQLSFSSRGTLRSTTGGTTVRAARDVMRDSLSVTPLGGVNRGK